MQGSTLVLSYCRWVWNHLMYRRTEISSYMLRGFALLQLRNWNLFVVPAVAAIRTDDLANYATRGGVRHPSLRYKNARPSAIYYI